jgi:ribosomal protein S18 acetylase RimI-like enzyme
LKDARSIRGFDDFEMTAHVRDALPSDAEVLAGIHIDSWRHTYRGIMPDAFLDSLSLARWTGDWVERLKPSARRTFVIEDEGAVAGWVSVGTVRDSDLNSDFGELYGIYIAPSRLRRSFGRQLCDRAEAELAIEGKVSISLWVLDGNMNARRFYERCGFQPDGIAKTFKLGGADLLEVRYTKKIRPPTSGAASTPFEDL